jgi:NitT/TauT family transport system ATP-binding protein
MVGAANMELSPPSPGAAITLRAVAKTYDNGARALGPLDLDIGHGEFVALVGPSGCGKSTVLRLIAGLRAPTAGALILMDAPRAPRMGFVFQEPTLMPWATVAENVSLPLRLQRKATPARVAAELMQVGLSDFAGCYPHELSGGMKMRASLARALVTDPTLLLMDEPFAALDEITRFQLNDELLELWRRRGLTVAFVTHSVFEAVYLAERVVVMTPRPGRVAAEFRIAADTRDAAFRLSADYLRHCRAVSDALAQAASEAGR